MHISSEDPHEPISTKFGISGPLADLIIHANFFGNLLWGVEFCHFPISRRSPLTQCWRYCAACENMTSVINQTIQGLRPAYKWLSDINKLQQNVVLIVTKYVMLIDSCHWLCHLLSLKPRLQRLLKHLTTWYTWCMMVSATFKYICASLKIST